MSNKSGKSILLQTINAKNNVLLKIKFKNNDNLLTLHVDKEILKNFKKNNIINVHYFDVNQNKYNKIAVTTDKLTYEKTLLNVVRNKLEKREVIYCSILNEEQIDNSNLNNDNSILGIEYDDAVILGDCLASRAELTNKKDNDDNNNQ